MSIQVIMPSLGESVVEGTISKWLKKVGDPVEEYEPLLEVNTDKVDSEIPSPGSGVLLDILVPEGETVTAGTVLAWIGEPGEQISATSESDRTAQGSALTRAEGSPATLLSAATSLRQGAGREHGLGFISPVVARIAVEHGVDLSQVPGSGQGGRITKKDILAYIEQQKTGTAAPKPEAFGIEPIGEILQPAQVSQEAPEKFKAPLPEAIPGEILPMTTVRRAIADHMVLSKRTSPHVTTVMEADLSRVVVHRQANKAAFQRDGVNLTFTAYFVAASISAIKAYPIVNSSWSDSGIILHRAINIGMATSLGEGGLIVPVIKNADSLSLLGLARTVNDLASRARNRQLKPDEVKEGTFTITNHGISGSLFATPIINQPQCAILGVGAIQKRVVVIDDAIAIRPMVYLSLTFDHRILDGVIADYFLGKVVETLQNWPEE